MKSRKRRQEERADVPVGELSPTGGTISRRDLLKAAALSGAAMSMPQFLSTFAADVPVARAAPGKRRRIVFMTHSVDPFFIPIIVGVKEFTKLAGWDYQFTGPQKADNVPEIVNVLERLLATKPDVFAMTISDPTAQNRVIEQAMKRGITVICFNAQTRSVREKYGIPWVGMPDEDSGYINGQLAAKYAQQVTGRKDGEIVVTLIVPGAPNLETRAKYTIDAIKDYNKKNGTNFTWSKFASDLDENTALQRIQAKWSADKDKIVAFAHTDWGDWYLGDFMDQNKLQGKFANGGFDLLPGVMTHMKKKNIQWSLGQNPYAQGWVTCALGHMAVERKYPPKDYQTGPEVVTEENLAVVAAREEAWRKVRVTEIKVR